MANTPNFALYKPNRADTSVEVDTSLSDNFTKIDTELKNNKDGLDTHKNNPNAHTSENVSHADGSVKSTLENHEERIGDLETDADALEIRVNDIETLGLDVLAPTLEGRLATVESDVEGFLAPATFDAMDQQSYTFDEYRIGYVENKLKRVDGVYNVKQYDVVGDGVVGDSDSIQAMINTVRSNVIANGLTSFYTVEVPSGTYIIDKEIKMSPYIKLKSLGPVIFKITHNGTAFWIAPTTGDPTWTQQQIYHLNKNMWNTGDYFDGSNGAFTFISTLDKDSTGYNVTAIELGDRTTSSNAGTPISRYNISYVNVFNIDTAFKWNSVNHYIGTYKRCHIEGNNHAVNAISLTTGGAVNSGENFIFDNCVIAGHKKEAILLGCAGHDVTFMNCSFDFNSSPVFRSLYAGTCIRVLNCYLEKIGNGTTEEQLLYVSDNQSAGTFYSRNSFYAKNFVMFLQRPTQLFKNNPNLDSSRISLFLDLEIELRFADIEVLAPYTLDNRFMVKSGENIFITRHKIMHMNTIRNLVSKDLNMLSNGDFSKSALVADLSVGGSDPYWYCSFKSNTTGVSIVNEGIGGTQCLKWTTTNTTTNSIKLESKFMFNVQPSEQLFLSSIFRADKVSPQNEFQYRFEFYDDNNFLLTTFNYYDFPTAVAGIATVDGTQFRMSRSVANVFVPQGATKVKPYVIVANMNSTTVWLDDIHLAKSK